MSVAAWALGVGIVLADSSIVTLALPEILVDFDSGVFGVSWVLIAYNLVLALVVLPLARRTGEAAVAAWRGGIVAFSLASAVCALAPSLEVLIAARCVQALGGAAIVVGAIELLARAAGSHRQAARKWGLAGTVGLALGPAAGGLLTELLSWQSIFLVQIPILAALLTITPQGGQHEREHGPEGELDLRPEWALALLSAGLTAALFLLVILLINGWGLSPIAAALVVSVIPAATLAFSRVRTGENAIPYAIAGAIATAGGLAALGVLPGASPDLTVAPQILVGAGLALAVPVLTAAALNHRDPAGTRAAATIAARHAGIVLGLVILTPILSLQLTRQQDAGRDAGTALLLDAPLPPGTKIEIAGAIEEEIDRAEQQGALPDITRAFAGIEVEGEDDEDLALLRAQMEDQLERAATHAFSLPFLGAAALAGLALIPLRAMRRRED